jgi:CheY-like chemotaxis protein/two-component sensor histidine kinase
MLRAGSLGADRTTRALQAIYDNATRQARLIDELLDVSRIVAGRVALDLRESDLREIIRGAVEAMMPQAEAKRLEMQLGPSPPVFVVADARRLEQVFLNLLSNAVKFTPAGGRVEVNVAVTDTAIDVRVSDTGIGMDPSFVPHAFDQFRQADSQTTRVHGGLGLGLSIARRLVEAHGGRIRVDSEGPGRGTSCIVSLPIAALRVGEAQLTPATSAAPPAGVHDLPDLSSVRILVVDDEPDAREMTSAALERCGATVVVAASAEEALAVLGRTDVDVLLADIGMPGEDGYSLMRKVRALASARTASVPAAAVTAYAREDQRHEALAAGFQVHLAKPLDPYRLAQTVVKLARTAV